MQKTILTLTAIVLAAATGATCAQQGFSTVEERMTGKEFTDAGLDKLSAEELATLNDWLRAHSVATLENRNQEYTDTRGFESRAMQELDDSDVVSPIKGEFSGWSGDTVFELENGMIWQQTESGTFYIPPTTRAVAVIEQGVFNSWRLKVQGYNRSVSVKRLE